jgi:hypothetical protein
MMMRPQGVVRIWERRFEKRRGLWVAGDFQQQRNLFVNAGKPELANLLAGVTGGEYVLALGFGSGTATPAVTDTGLTSPVYYNAIGSSSFPSSGSVLFNFALAPADYASAGITVTEVGLFANTATVALPAAVGTSNPSWAASHAQTVGNLIVDSNGNIQRCTTAGSTGTAAPTWATTIGSTTNDSTGGGTVVWTLVAKGMAPGPMFARALVSSFSYDGSSTFSGTWTLTF